MQIERARRLRREATFPERILWSLLRANNLCGLKFRRQHPVGPYVVDYFCAAKRLAVELDGWSHDDTARRDAARTAYLSACGIRVVRFSNDEVLANRMVVANAIATGCGVEW